MIDKKVVLWGAYGTGNFGDDLLLVCLMKILFMKHEESEIAVRNRSGEEYIKLWYPTIHTIVDNDRVRTKYLIFGGGTQFFSFPISPKSMRQKLSIIKRNASRFFLTIRRNRFRNIEFDKSISYSVGIGPIIRDKQMESIVKKWININDIIVTRDNDSYNLVLQNNPNVKLFPDIVFNTDLWLNDDFIIKENTINEKRISFIIRDWPFNNIKIDYLSKTIEAANYLKKRGFKINFFLFKVGDIKSMNIIRSHGYELFIWDPYKYSINEYVKLISNKTDIIISSRAHGIVLSNILNIPNISIIIDEKLKLIRYNHEGVDWIPPFDKYKLEKKVNNIFVEYDDVKKRMKTSNDMILRESKKSVELILKYI